MTRPRTGGRVTAEYPAGFPYGTRVHYVVKPWRYSSGLVGGGDGEEGEGVFALHWLGIEEVYDVVRDDGRRVSLHPYKGDRMEAITYDEPELVE